MAHCLAGRPIVAIDVVVFKPHRFAGFEGGEIQDGQVGDVDGVQPVGASSSFSGVVEAACAARSTSTMHACAESARYIAGNNKGGFHLPPNLRAPSPDKGSRWAAVYRKHVPDQRLVPRASMRWSSPSSSASLTRRPLRPSHR